MISTESWKTRGRYETIDNRQIFLVNSCAGNSGGDQTDTILLIHGFPTSSWDWVKIWEPLSQNYRLIAMDMLGFGLSDKPNPHDYTIHEQSDLIEALVSKLGLKRFHVLAHDYGDTVAQELLARQNEGAGAGDWQSLCLLNGGLFPETHKALLIQKLLLSPLGPLVNKLTSRRRFDSSVSRVFGPNTQPSQLELDGFWELINHNEGRHIFHNLIFYMRDRKIHRARWVSALKDAQIPIGLINGSVDPVSGAHMIARYKEIIGEPDFLAELPAIGHYPQTEAPQEMVTHYNEFLRRVKLR